MKPLLPLLALALLATAPALQACAADQIGVRLISVTAPERATRLDVTLWYPAAPGGALALIGDSRVFQGTAAHQEAPIARGPYPVILLSHGGLRAAPNLDGWVAAALAAQGFVVATAHPPRLGAENAWEGPREIWLRPADLSALLTALEREPSLAGKIDARRVGALGFQLGGAAVLALAGARLDAQIYARSCDKGNAGLDCAWFAKHAVDLHEIDAGKLGRSSLDPRIKAVVAVDPELVDTFTAASLSGISMPLHIINLGRSSLGAARLAAFIPEARYDVIAEATVFDAFSECKPEGPAILRDDGDDEALCESESRSRAAIHAQLAAMIAAAFERQLQRGM